MRPEVTIAFLSQSNAANTDLLAAIAVHFSRPVQFEKPTQLGAGVTALVFNTTNSPDESDQDQAVKISNRLYQISQPFFSAAGHTTDKDLCL